MSTEKRPYKVIDSFLRGQSYWFEGDIIYLNDAEASKYKGKIWPVEKEDGEAVKAKSTDLSAAKAIAIIEQSAPEDLQGFVPQGEDRVTVIRAWENKMNPEPDEPEMHETEEEEESDE